LSSYAVPHRAVRSRRGEVGFTAPKKQKMATFGSPLIFITVFVFFSPTHPRHHFRVHPERCPEPPRPRAPARGFPNPHHQQLAPEALLPRPMRRTGYAHHPAAARPEKVSLFLWLLLCCSSRKLAAEFGASHLRLLYDHERKSLIRTLVQMCVMTDDTTATLHLLPNRPTQQAGKGAKDDSEQSYFSEAMLDSAVEVIKVAAMAAAAYFIFQAMSPAAR
jgi:hypothetical protein